MGNSELDTSLLDNAIRFAVQAHAGTERRGKGFPYIVHPLEAMAIVATMTSDQELLAAAALHDILEDTDLTVEDLRKTFGDRIARIVEEESDTECHHECFKDILYRSGSLHRKRPADFHTATRHQHHQDERRNGPQGIRQVTLFLFHSHRKCFRNGFGGTFFMSSLLAKS
jgi:hypothetical protein